MPKTLSQAEFMTEVQKMSEYKEYAGIVHSAAAQAWALATFEVECLRKDGAGFYESKTDVGEKQLKFQPGVKEIKFKDDASRKAFFISNSRSPRTFLIYELDKIAKRQQFLAELAKSAGKGDLGRKMQVLPESTYYAAPPAPAWDTMNMKQKIHAWPPPQPAASSPTAATIARTKAKAWVSKASAESTKIVDAYAKTAGNWPLGTDPTMLREINNALAPDAPPFRQVGGTGTLYPSSVGGYALLKWIMEGFKTRTAPPRGSAAWENWALYLFGAIMTSQGFTDGNKRVARAVYAIMMVSGGVDFRAMTDKYGESLGPMK